MPRFDGPKAKTLVDLVSGRAGLQPGPARPRREAVADRTRGHGGPVPAAPVRGRRRDVKDPDKGAKGNADACRVGVMGATHTFG